VATLVGSFFIGTDLAPFDGAARWSVAPADSALNRIGAALSARWLLTARRRAYLVSA